MVVTIDFETKSYADLTKVGAWVYSLDPTTDIICVAYGIDDEPIKTWWPGKKGVPMVRGMPHDLYVAIMGGHEFEAHNVSFERSIIENVMVARYDWIKPAPWQYRDTMATACYYAMPPKLDRLAAALGFGGKDPEGARLITKYSKLHLKSAKTVIPPEDFKKFVDYCVRDVLLEQAVSDELGDLPERELEVFLADQEMNYRGLYLDEEGIRTATKIVADRAATLTKEFRKLTGLNPTQGKALMVWFKDQGAELENLQAPYLEELLEEGDLPSGPARRAIAIRLKINKASTKKLDAMLRQRDPSGRARFQTRYHGALTGRNTGSGFQPLNLNRGFDDMDPDQLVRDIMYGDADWLDGLYGDATDAVAKASRYWIKAEEGNKIIAGDFVSIEAVLLACLAGEQWKIDAFAKGVKIYEHMADKIYGLPPGTVTKKTHPQERQDGKTGELAFGYQGALGAWLKFDSSGRHTDERIIEICKAWRAEHPAIVKLWAELEKAAIEAVRFPGRETGYRDVGFEIVDEWLSMIGPDGKRIWYRDPRLEAKMPQWHKPRVNEDCAAGTCDCRPRAQITYMAQKEGQWKRVTTYGGKLTENYTQFVSRQVLVPARKRLETHGYSTILTVYDEVVSEVPKNFGSVEEYKEIMAESPGPWAAGWPIGVDVWIGDRYKK